MPAKAQLTLNGRHYDVELLNQSFYLSTGWNGHGHPRHTLSGDGQLCILMNTPADNFILELMMKTEETPLAEGTIRNI